MLVVLYLGIFGLFLIAHAPQVLAAAKQSTLTLSITDETSLITVIPLTEGNFGKSSDVAVNVNTDNFTGYNLRIASGGSRNLINGSGDEITSISSAVSEATFSAGDSYNNKWGYKPSQYITTSNGINTVTVNTNFLPAPSLDGDILAVTNAANSSTDTYTLTFGAKVDRSLPAGSYSTTYVLTAIANSIVYNITYDDNTSETVSNMPSPNPQALMIDGGMPTAESYAALSNAIPTMNTGDMSFGGWCDVATTIDTTTDNYVCSGNIYKAGDDFPIDQTVSGANITLYAIWLKDPFPTVWSQMGKCVFNNGTISGSECQDYINDDFIDTGIALYSNDN